MLPINAARAAVAVTITSDLMCPWCYIGLRKLQEASKVVNVETHITWKPFMLRPQIPEQGTPKGGTPSSRVGPNLEMAGKAVGIDFTGLTDRTPNTSLFHATMHALEGHASQTAFHEAVFDAYFTRGIFPDPSGLLQCAKQVGLGDEVSALYANPSKVHELQHLVEQEAQDASRRGIHGVPFFEFEGELAFSGAQEVGTFVKYLRRYATMDSTSS